MDTGGQAVAAVATGPPQRLALPGLWPLPALGPACVPRGLPPPEPPLFGPTDGLLGQELGPGGGGGSPCPGNGLTGQELGSGEGCTALPLNGQLRQKGLSLSFFFLPSFSPKCNDCVITVGLMPPPASRGSRGRGGTRYSGARGL